MNNPPGFHQESRWTPHEPSGVSGVYPDSRQKQSTRSPGGVSVRIYINLFIIKKSATLRIEPRTMGTFSVIKPTAPQQHILGYKLVATYHPFCPCQIREQLAQIVPNVSSFQPPPSPTACRTTTSATATTTDANNNNNNNDNNNDNKEQQRRWHPTHSATTKLLMWHAYGLTEHATLTVTLRMTTSMTPGPHDEGQGPQTTTIIIQQQQQLPTTTAQHQHHHPRRQ